MSKTVEITLEIESGLTNNAVEGMYRDQFGDSLVSVNAFDTPDIYQDPVDGTIVNTQWADPETYVVDVEKNGETFREYYTFDSVEALSEEAVAVTEDDD